MDGAKIPLTFRIYKGDQLLRTETLTQPVIKIGKLSSSHLRIDDELVSRMHAVIEVTGPGEISVIDLGSTKGTIVNGQKVNKARLQDGDVIVLGDTRIVLAVGEATANLDQDAPTAVNTRIGEDAPAAPAPPVMASTPRPPPAPPAFSAPSRPLPPPAAPPSYAAPSSFAAPPPSAPAYGGGGGGGGGGFGAPPQFGMDAGSDAPGMRAIEVAAMLSDSVVAVKHLTDPKSGKVTTTTYGLYAAGFGLLFLTVIALVHGYGVAADNHKAYEHWVEVEKKPALDFRPRRMNAGWDALTLFGLFGGLISITWASARALEEKKSPYFRIGRASDVEFPTEASPMESFPLVAPQGDDFVFSWSHGMRGEMAAQGKTTPLDQLPSTIQIPLGARIRVESGPNTFLISSVPAPARQTGAWLASLEGVVLAFFAGSALAHLGFLALLYSIPPDEKGLALDVLGDNERLAKVQVKPMEDPKQLEDLTQNQKDDGQQSGGTGTKQAGEEGKMGKKDSTRQSGQYAMKKVDGVAPQLAKQQAIEAARNSGILGTFKSQPGGAFASLTGTGDFSSGLDDRDVYGGLIGNEVGEMQGGWGYGISGTGPGGGGTGLGTIGLGRYGTIGHGSGTGTGYGVGSGKGGMRGRSASQPRVNIGNATATGDLDKNIIRRYIRQKLPQIQHCYEKQLVVKPSLQGTVTTQFTISGNGNVTAARAGGMGDGSVENCVADVIKSIQFPKPTGGGIVNVTYPFTFRPAGE
jgi:pSer/pThr/pTyr-binding forkhead associated (FHA) protein